MMRDRQQAHSDDRGHASADPVLAPGKRTLTEGLEPDASAATLAARSGAAPANAPAAQPRAPDSIDKQVAELPADQRDYYAQIIADSPAPTDSKTRKDALARVKTSRPLSEADREAVIAAQQKLASMQATPIDDGSNPHLHQIEITFDGTWNSRDDMVYDTNPALINEQFEGDKDYQVGVGTSRWTKLIGGATGAGIGNRIDSAYRNLVARINSLKSSDPQAEVVLIVSGFSRGSTAARAFVNELNKRGVPDLDTGDGKGHYEKYFEGPRIGVMVLFDTVASVGLPGNNINPGLDLSIPANAENVLHLTAADEKRTFFPLSSAVDPSQPDDSRITEVALPGAHSDVGGSYPNAYSKIPLAMSNDYMRQRGVHIKPMTADERVDPSDPKLRLHDSGAPLWGDKRTVYPSHNPKPAQTNYTGTR